MKVSEVVEWMLAKLSSDSCLYQDDVVDYLVKNNSEELLKENNDGNQVLGSELLSLFRKQTKKTVVWVRSDRYWRYRVKEDEEGRTARG